MIFQRLHHKQSFTCIPNNNEFKKVMIGIHQYVFIMKKEYSQKLMLKCFKNSK